MNNFSYESPSLARSMNFPTSTAPSAEEEEELFQIQRAANAFAGGVSALPAVPVVRKPSFSSHGQRRGSNPFQQLKHHQSTNEMDVLAAAALQTYRKNSGPRHQQHASSAAIPALLKSSASAASLLPAATSFASYKRKSAVKRRSSGGALTLIRPAARSDDAPATKSSALTSGGKSFAVAPGRTPPGSMSKLTRSLSGGKHRYSDSYLAAGLHGRKGGSIRQIVGGSNGGGGNKNATWGQLSSSSIASAPTAYSRTAAASAIATATNTATTSPLQHLCKMLEANGRDSSVRSTLSAPPNFFLENTEERIASYAHDVVNAVRSRDIPTLCRLRSEEGRTLQCCNRFGESLVHMACRRGFLDVVRFLLSPAEEDGAGGNNNTNDPVSLWVRDDYGRTPLHDACWVPQPNFELMDLLLDWYDNNPANEGRAGEQLLLMSDKRGHTPLDYVRREHWDRWNAFLEKRFGGEKSTNSAFSKSMSILG